MPCDTVYRRRQTPAQRKAEVKAVATKIGAALAAGTVKAKIGPQGAVAFIGFTENRDDVTDACVYRQLMVHGTAQAKAAIQRAEMLAGRKVDQEAIKAGIHSHDGGNTWGSH